MGRSVGLWGAFPEDLTAIRKAGENKKYLPGIPFPKAIGLYADLAEAIPAAPVVIIAVPSQFVRSVLRKVPPALRRGRIWISVAKGIEQKTLKRMSEVVSDELGSVRVCAVSGPSIAHEVARGKPASVVAAAQQRRVAEQVQALLMGGTLRVYTSTDLMGVELGGALKNPLAIAAGIADGLDLGMNAKAALLARGVVEMARLGVALGAKKTTFYGLSGMGDLITTCLGGRNHWLGVQLGQGKALKEVLASVPSVIEGVETAKSSTALARKHGLELPIIEQVKAVLFHGRTPRRALEHLLRREAKPEGV
jgi:glycerol-3-phosphate dehydrogenase (NAD(P)+)